MNPDDFVLVKYYITLFPTSKIVKIGTVLKI